MAHFAHIKDGIVDQVIVIEQEMLDTGLWGDPTEWAETVPEAKEGSAKGKNYAGVGYAYEKTSDSFVPPKQYESFVLNQLKGVYESPVVMPKDGKEYVWNEPKQEWETGKVSNVEVTEEKVF